MVSPSANVDTSAIGTIAAALRRSRPMVVRHASPCSRYLTIPRASFSGSPAGTAAGDALRHPLGRGFELVGDAIDVLAGDGAGKADDEQCDLDVALGPEHGRPDVVRAIGHARVELERRVLL